MTLGARVTGVRRLVPAVSKIMFGAAFRNDPARATELAALEDCLGALNPVGVQRATHGILIRRSVEHLLPELRLPVQVVSGEGDTAVVPARARSTAEAIPNARFVVIPRAGHTPTLEEPMAVTEVLREFFASVDARA